MRKWAWLESKLLKRRLFKLALFILLGAIANIVVAWSIALTSEVPSLPLKWELLGERIDHRQGSFRMQQYSRFGVLHVRSFHLRVFLSSEKYQSIPKGETSHVFRGSDPIEHTPSWLAEYKTPCIDLSIDVNIGDVREAIAHGWPFLTVWGEREHKHFFERGQGENVPLRGKLKNPMSSGAFATERVIGFLPIWQGLIANTIFYCVLLYLLFLGILQLHKFKRIRRGQCIKCGYDLRGAEHEKCPECGSIIAVSI